MAKERELTSLTFFSDRNDRMVINRVGIDIRIRDLADEDYEDWHNKAKTFTDPSDIPAAVRTMLQTFLNS